MVSKYMTFELKGATMLVNRTPRPATGFSPRLCLTRRSNRVIFLPLFLLAILLGATSAWAQTAVYQVNSGGSAASPYIADKYFSGGQTDSVTASINTSGV